MVGTPRRTQTNAERILEVLKDGFVLDDDELAKRLSISRQTVNQECRLLASSGAVVRERSPDKGKIVNCLAHGQRPGVPAKPATSVMAPRMPSALPATVALANSETLSLADYVFALVCDLVPAGAGGAIQAFSPQSRYQNSSNLKLNKYGAGPFCKFKIPSRHTGAGVYVITIDGTPVYVGECENLASRYNMGYGNISPRNCYQGGQETNCRINNLIYGSVEKGASARLWFLSTPDFKSVESQLRGKLRLPWNRI